MQNFNTLKQCKLKEEFNYSHIYFVYFIIFFFRKKYLFIIKLFSKKIIKFTL